MTMIDDRSPTRPHLTRDEAKEYERIEAITDPDTRALEYMYQVDALLKEAQNGECPGIPLFLRGPTADERRASWEQFVKEQGYSSQRFFVEKERKALDPSTERFLTSLAKAEADAKQLNNTGQSTKRVKRAAASERRSRRSAPGTITVQSIAEELKMLPRDARAALRAAKEPKPEIGWAGDETWAAHIREVLSKAPAKGARKSSGEARPPRGKRAAKREPLKPGDIVGSSKSIVKRDMTPPPNPLHKNILEKKASESITTGRTVAQVKSAAKRKASQTSASTHNVKLTDVLKGQGKRGAKVLERLSDAKRTKVAAKRAKSKGKRK
jgi:hypothetical protein